MVLRITIIIAAASLVSAQAASAPLWGQCGGVGFVGPTVCAPPATCTAYNPYYHQCIPGPTPISTRITTTATCEYSTYSSSFPSCYGATATLYSSACSGDPTVPIPTPTFSCTQRPTTTPGCKLSIYSTTYPACGKTSTAILTVCSGTPPTNIPVPSVTCGGSTTPMTTPCPLSTYTQYQSGCCGRTLTYFGSACSGGPTTSIFKTMFTCTPCSTTAPHTTPMTTPCPLSTYTQYQSGCCGRTLTYLGSVCSGDPTTNIPKTTFTCTPCSTTAPHTTPVITPCPLSIYTQLQSGCCGRTLTYLGSVCSGDPTTNIPKTTFTCGPCSTTAPLTTTTPSVTTPCPLSTFSQFQSGCCGRTLTYFGTVCSGEPTYAIPMTRFTCAPCSTTQRVG